MALGGNRERTLKNLSLQGKSSGFASLGGGSDVFVDTVFV